MNRINLIYGHDYETYIALREEIILVLGSVNNDYIYIINDKKLYFLNKRDISFFEIEKYEYVGQVVGHDLYVDTI